MARKRMVTRTVKGEKLLVLFFSAVTRDTFEKEVILTEKLSTEAKKLHHIESTMCETEKDIKPVAIISAVPIKTRYGMPEEDFIRYAEEIPMTNTDETEENSDV